MEDTNSSCSCRLVISIPIPTEEHAGRSEACWIFFGPLIKWTICEHRRTRLRQRSRSIKYGESRPNYYSSLWPFGFPGQTWKRRSLGSGVCSSPQVPPKKGLDSFLITPHRTPYSRILYQTLVLSSKSILTLPNTLTTILVCGAVFKA